jgi:hypothetical protein
MAVITWVAERNVVGDSTIGAEVLRPLVRAGDIIAGGATGTGEDIGALVRVGTTVGRVLDNLRADADTGALERAGAVLEGALLVVERHVTDSAASELRTLLGPLDYSSPAVLRLGYAQLSGWLTSAVVQESERGKIVWLSEVLAQAFG